MDSFQPKTVKRLVQFMYTGDYDETDEYEPSAAYQNACIADGVGAEEGEILCPNDLFSVRS